MLFVTDMAQDTFNEKTKMKIVTVLEICRVILLEGGECELWGSCNAKPSEGERYSILLHVYILELCILFDAPNHHKY